MKELLKKIYTETIPAFRPNRASLEDNDIKISFIEGVKVEILGDFDKEYEINFIDNEKNVNVYHTKIRTGMWCAPHLRYFVNWRIEIKCDGKIIKNEILNLNGKKVKIICDTNSMGDLLAFIGAIDEFQKKHSAEVHCVVFNSHIRKIFENSYNNIKFLAIESKDPSYYAQYKIGYFFAWNEGWAKQDPRSISLSKIAPSVLGLEEKEYKPKLKFDKAKLSDKKYVCIGTQSTAQCKYWNNPNGWNEVVKYINSIGYEVWCIDKSSSFGSGNHINHIPSGVVDKTGDFSLEDRMQQLSGAEFFIGIGSGLSWLAWSVSIPVILVSGFSKGFAEFNTPYRVINENVCNGCWNDTSHVFDKSKWDWCPRGKDFECSKQITSEMVINKIQKILNINSLSEFDFGINSDSAKHLLSFEFFNSENTTYERDFKVEENDIVFDIGANVGAFSFIALKKRMASKIIVVEPLDGFIPALNNNLSDPRVTIVKKAVAASETNTNILYDRFSSKAETILFKNLIKETNIEKIDFLKIDCEGGEYDVFVEENIEWILQNVRKISGEWHLSFPEFKEKFKLFREKILPRFKKYKIYSIDGVDITTSLYNENFITYYNEVIITIDNREYVSTNKEIINRWNFIPAENKFVFSLTRKIHSPTLILRERTTNLQCYRWEPNEFSDRIEYFIIPTYAKKLIETDFSGFIFDLYENKNHICSKELVFREVYDKKTHEFYFDHKIGLDIKDSFYVQYLDFYKNEFLEKIISENSIIIDVGASCGTFANACLNKNIKRIICLEPSPSFEILSKTFGPKVLCLNMALSTDNGYKNFHFTENTTLSTFDIESQIKNDTGNYIKKSIQAKIRCITLDRLLTELCEPIIDLLKFDIEGHEYEVFDSINPSVLNPINKILMEFHHNDGEKLNKITNKLELSGFNISYLNLGYKSEDTRNSAQGVIYAAK